MPFTIAIVTVVVGYTWIAEPLAGPAVVMPFAVAVLALAAGHAWRTEDWGWSTRALLPGLAAVSLWTAALGGALYVLAGLDAPARLDVEPSRMAWLFVWGLAQQWVLQTTVLREAEPRRAPRAWRGPVLAALVFGLLHLPNPALTLLTTVGAFGWCALYQRYPNVVPLALSQALGTAIFQALFDASVTGRLRVGYSYFEL